MTSVRVFGPFARGEARLDSDLDLLIEAGSATSAFFPGGLIADLEDSLGRKVEVVEEPGLHPLIKRNILKEAVAL